MRYAAAARARIARQPADATLLPKLREAEADFARYRRTECDAVAASVHGTARAAIATTCEISLTQARTHMLWADWLR